MRKQTLIWVVLAATLALQGCLSDPFSGGEVVLELGTRNENDIANQEGQHYEVFAVVGRGTIKVGSFFVDETLVAYAFPGGEKVGVANRQPADGLPQSGIFLVTEANLAGAEQVVVSIAEDDDPRQSPGGFVVARGALDGERRSVLYGDLEGYVPVLGGGRVPLSRSRVALVLGEEEAE